MYRRLEHLLHQTPPSTKYGGQPIIHTCQICLAILPIVRNAKRMAGRAMRILPARRVYTVLTPSPFMKNGWPITRMNNEVMGFYLPLYQPVAGGMNGATARTGQAPSPSFPG